MSFGVWQMEARCIQDKTWSHQCLRWCISTSLDFLIQNCGCNVKNHLSESGRVYTKYGATGINQQSPTAEQLISMLPVLWGFIQTCFSGVGSVPIRSCSQSGVLLDDVLSLPFLIKEFILHFWAPPQLNPSAVKRGLSAASQVHSSVLKSEYRLIPFLKMLFCRRSYAGSTPA